MRYIINDEDFEAWIKYLEAENKTLDNHTIQYVIDEMKLELTQHTTKPTVENPLPKLSVKNSFALFLADFKARRDS